MASLVSLGSTSLLQARRCAVLDARGGLVKEAKLPSEPEALTAFILGLPIEVTAVGLEAGPLSQWLHKALADAGIPVVLMETRQVKAAFKAMPVKTDRRDAEGIARLLQMGWFRPVHCKSVSAQEMRALLAARRAIQKAALDVELSARAGCCGTSASSSGPISRGGYAARVRERADGNAMLETMAEAVLRAREALRAELAGLEHRLRDLARHDPVCRLMMTMPGVGPLVALTVKSALDAPERFGSSKDVGPWVGLTPARRQSGEMDVVGSITRAGDAGLRCALCQAATVMMHRRQAVLAEGPGRLQLARRRGMKRAVVAVARRMGVILHRM